MDYIYCAGEQGRVVLDILNQRGHQNDVVFIDDDESKWGETVAGCEVVGGREVLSKAGPQDRCIVAFGRQSIRLRLAEIVREHDLTLFSAIHPDVSIGERTSAGDGVIVNGQTYIGPDVELEDFVLLDSTVNVSHDVLLKRGTTVTPNVTIAGGVEVGEDAYLGAGATIIDHVSIGDGAVVGAGAVVTDDVSGGETVAGVPAEPL